jgi:RNA-directed DNA polymerase
VFFILVDFKLVDLLVVKDFIELRFEKIFSPNSDGDRPNKSAHQALELVRVNCRKTDWVIDLDIKGFFDNIDHNKLMLAAEKHVPESWAKLYIARWLAAPVLTKSGKLVTKQGKGTPQGGVISPLLANLFLHYGFDKWLEQTDPTVNFTRYGDDVIVHCKSKVHAEQTLKVIRQRMNDVGLELHPKKTKIVYCRDYRRQEKYPEVRFDFLGYSFQPRTTKSKKTNGMFLGFDCAISIGSRKRIADKLGELRVEKLSFKSIVGVAQFLQCGIKAQNFQNRTEPIRLFNIKLLFNRRRRIGGVATTNRGLINL